MRKLVEYPTPSLSERDRRWAAVRKEMDARGLDGLILCGWPAMWDFNEPTLFLWAADAHPYPHPFRVPTMRPLAKGDMIICEMHPKFGGYFTHVERTFCLSEPEPRYLDIYDACLAAYRRGLDLFKPRAKISQVMDAVRDTIEGSGFGICGPRSATPQQRRRAG